MSYFGMYDSAFDVSNQSRNLLGNKSKVASKPLPQNVRR